MKNTIALFLFFVLCCGCFSANKQVQKDYDKILASIQNMQGTDSDICFSVVKDLHIEKDSIVLVVDTLHYEMSFYGEITLPEALDRLYIKSPVVILTR